MRIAIIGWGSLIWDTGELPIEKDGWKKGGPVLPIELSRISARRCEALTLVIDPENGTEVPTRFAISTRKEIDDAICDVRTREGTTLKNIGYVDLVSDTYHCKPDYPQAVSIITKWAKERRFDVVIWTDLRSNFQDKQHKEFSVPNALEYLHNLSPAQAKEARKYIKNAPEEVMTKLRKEVLNDPWPDEE